MEALYLLVVILVVAGVVLALLREIGVDAVIQKWIRILVLVIVLLYILGWFFGFAPSPPRHFRLRHPSAKKQKRSRASFCCAGVIWGLEPGPQSSHQGWSPTNRVAMLVQPWSSRGASGSDSPMAEQGISPWRSSVFFRLVMATP